MFCCWVLLDKFSIIVNDVDFSLNSRQLDLAYSTNYCLGVFLITCSNRREKIYAIRKIWWRFCILQSHSLGSRQGEMGSTGWVAVVQTVRHSAGWQLYKMYTCTIWNFLFYTNHFSLAKTLFYCKQIVYLIRNWTLGRISCSVFNLTTMSLANYFLLISIFFYIGSLKLAADCPRKCEQSRGSISKTGIKNRAMQGHSFKNYTLLKPYDCHVKCFEERCKCQAYQMRQNRCELLDDDRISAPEDFLEEKEYTYYDMNREYVDHQVTKQSCPTVPGFANGKKGRRVVLTYSVKILLNKSSDCISSLFIFKSSLN